MKKFRKVWDNDKHEFLKLFKDVDRNVVYRLFLGEFDDVSDVTFTAFSNERSRIGAVNYKGTAKAKPARPLYSEQEKKGYVRIKIAQPNVWISKAKWVWHETHPWEVYETDNSCEYIFLDGDNRNFAPENIYRLERRYCTVFNNMGGTVKGFPELTELHIQQAKLKLAALDLGESLGLTVNFGGGRGFREDWNRKVRNWHRKAKERDPEAYSARLKAQRKRHWELMSEEKKEAYREKRRAYCREWARRKREEKKCRRT